eukprot:scaffold241_cov242-Pinguiococcus_pyrenoidosus.AAC.27
MAESAKRLAVSSWCVTARTDTAKRRISAITTASAEIVRKPRYLLTSWPMCPCEQLQLLPESGADSRVILVNVFIKNGDDPHVLALLKGLHASHADGKVRAQAERCIPHGLVKSSRCVVVQAQVAQHLLGGNPPLRQQLPKRLARPAQLGVSQAEPGVLGETNLAAARDLSAERSQERRLASAREAHNLRRRASWSFIPMIYRHWELYAEHIRCGCHCECPD